MSANFKILLSATALILSGLFSSCEEPKDTRVEVTVLDASGQPVEGALVNLEGEPSDSVYAHRLSLYDLDESTNPSGVAAFIFSDFYDQGDNGFAVLSVTVTKDTLEGAGYVKVIEEETQTVTISIN